MLAAAALAAGAYLVWDPPSADLVAQAFRADLFAREGFTLFSTAWYGGHHTPAYSVLFPPLAAWLTPQWVGALAAVAATWALAALAGRTAALLVVPGLVASLVSGRLTFVLGCAFGVAGVLAAARGRPWLAALGGALTALASPLAALFAALAGAALAAPGVRHPAVVAGGTRRSAGTAPARGAPGVRHPAVVAGGTRGVEGGGGAVPGVALVAGAALAVLVLVVAFPEGGTFPFAVSAFLPAVAAGVAVAVVAPPGPLRTGAALYAALCLAAFVVPSPIGGNATRLGALLAAPVAVALLWPRRRVALALLALPIAYWVAQPPVRDVLRAGDDPSAQAAFHRPLVAFLARRGATGTTRIEIPFTQSHGEARWVAPRVAIARGWERQVDRERNALFYADEPLDPAAYERWLRANAIGYVALPLGVSLDASAEEERALLERGQPYLREIGRPGRWRVWAVEDATPLAAGAARLEAVRPEGFVLDGDRGGTTTIRVHHTPYWALLSGRGCVERAPGGWTRVRARGPGRLVVGTRFAPGRVRATSPRCR